LNDKKPTVLEKKRVYQYKIKLKKKLPTTGWSFVGAREGSVVEEVVGLLVGARGCGQSAIRNSKKKHKSDIKMREIHSKHKEMVLKMGSFQSQYCAEKSPYTNGA